MCARCNAFVAYNWEEGIATEGDGKMLKRCKKAKECFLENARSLPRSLARRRLLLFNRIKFDLDGVLFCSFPDISLQLDSD